jgi:hypothetical protein
MVNALSDPLQFVRLWWFSRGIGILRIGGYFLLTVSFNTAYGPEGTVLTDMTFIASLVTSFFTTIRRKCWNKFTQLDFGTHSPGIVWLNGLFASKFRPVNTIICYVRRIGLLTL